MSEANQSLESDFGSAPHRVLTEFEILSMAGRLNSLYTAAKTNDRSLTQEKLGAAIGMGQSAVSQYLRGEIALNLPAAVKFANFFQVPVNELVPELFTNLRLRDQIVHALRAIDDVPLTKETSSDADWSRKHFMPSANHDRLSYALRHYGDASELSTDYVVIPRREIKLSAGPGHANFDWEEPSGPPLAFTADWCKKKGVNPDQAAIVSVIGNSMEPFLFEDDLVLIATNQTDVRRYSARHWRDRIFAIRYGDDLRLKSLQVLADETMRITSVNKDEFPPEDVKDPELVTVIGRMVARA